jgi:hypothetical protein
MGINHPSYFLVTLGSAWNGTNGLAEDEVIGVTETSGGGVWTEDGTETYNTSTNRIRLVPGTSAWGGTITIEAAGTAGWLDVGVVTAYGSAYTDYDLAEVWSGWGMGSFGGGVFNGFLTSGASFASYNPDIFKSMEELNVANVARTNPLPWWLGRKLEVNWRSPQARGLQRLWTMLGHGGETPIEMVVGNDGYDAGYSIDSVKYDGALLRGAYFSRSGDSELDLDGTGPLIPSGVWSITIACRPLSFAQSKQTLLYWRNASRNDYLHIYFQNTGKLTAYLASGAGGGNKTLTSNSTFSVDVPYWIALTYDGTTCRLYVNGYEEGSVAQTFNIGGSTGRLFFGNELNHSWELDGTITEIGIYYSLLDERAVRARYDPVTRWDIYRSPFKEALEQPIYKAGAPTVAALPPSLPIGRRNPGQVPAPVAIW